MATMPTPDQIQEFLAGPADRPVVMLNLLVFKEHADGEFAGRSGRDVVREYSEAMRTFVTERGGSFVFAGDVDSQLIGEGGEQFGFVGIMRYPSRQRFVELAGDPEVAATIGRYRDAGLESQWLFAMSEVED